MLTEGLGGQKKPKSYQRSFWTTPKMKNGNNQIPIAKYVYAIVALTKQPQLNWIADTRVIGPSIIEPPLCLPSL